MELLTCIHNHAQMTVTACNARRNKANEQRLGIRPIWEPHDYHLEKCYDCPGLQPNNREEAMDEIVKIKCKGPCGRELEKTGDNFYWTGSGNLDTTCKKCRLERQKETKRKAWQAAKRAKQSNTKKQERTPEPKPSIPEKKPEADSHVHLSVCGREIGEISSPTESEPDFTQTVEGSPQEDDTRQQIDAAPESVRRCRVCGCTQDRYWVQEDLCSTCSEAVCHPLAGHEVVRFSFVEIEAELADRHWTYVDELLATHGIIPEDRQMIGFHYRSAFVHGYKHGVAAS